MTNEDKRTLATDVYKKIKRKDYGSYNEKAHCLSILTVMMGPNPYQSEFCRINGVPRRTMTRWLNDNKTFKECYEVGIEFAYSNWVRDAENMKDNEEFNHGHWKFKGKLLFQVGESRRLKLDVKKDDTPYEQYKSIMNSASEGAFTATELKQIMESVMVGARAYESDELAKRIDEIESDVEKGQRHSEQNISTIEQFKKEN